MLIAITIVLLAIPLVILRGRTLLRAYGTLAALDLFALLLARQLPGIEPLWVGALNFAVLCLFIAKGEHVRWSANRAAVVAALVYALLVPAMTRVPVDGDEPYYLLLTESLVHDHDLDLANQYATLAQSKTGRTDLVPQLGDPIGKHGERYSRHEPFLPMLMVPGYLIGGLQGAVATIALFGVLLVRSTIRLMEDEGISDEAARAVFPLFAFGPPILFYAARIWPEVPAAWFFVEAIRGVRQHRMKKWIPAMLGLVLLKLRFVLVAAPLLLWTGGRRRAWLIPVIFVPLAIAWLVTGSATSVHSLREFLPGQPRAYLNGFLGLLLDGMSGIAFQAPFYLLGIYALTRPRSTPPAFKIGCVAASIYVLLLLPRAEWHGGWAPPLRYIVFLMPVLALGAAAVWEHTSAGVIAIISAWTIGLAIHGLTWPWRLFHIANGENLLGEWLSTHWHADASRFFPSLIRPNAAAWIAALALVALLLLARLRIPSSVAVSCFAVVLALGVARVRQPGDRIDFEDAHVIHNGGALDPPYFTVARFLYRGGWTLRDNESLSVLARSGAHTLAYTSDTGALVEIAGNAYPLAPSKNGSVRVTVPRTGRVLVRVLHGSVTLDRMEHD